jgi:hypothetical protein
MAGRGARQWVWHARDHHPRDALSQAKALTASQPLPLFAGDLGGETLNEPAAHLTAMTPGGEVVDDYVATRLSLKAYPLSLLRHHLAPDAPRSL